MIKHWPLFVLLAAACGGGTKAQAVTALPAAAATAPSKASIDAFHELLAPLWHAPESPERTERTCAAVPSLEARAQEVGDAPLVEAVHALHGECGADRQAFQARFAAVHTAFHAAMERGGVAHEHHE